VGDEGDLENVLRWIHSSRDFPGEIKQAVTRERAHPSDPGQ
jgi:hypothetical protein